MYRVSKTLVRPGLTLRHTAVKALSSDPPKVPERARVVVIGGGIIGTSVAYHLGHAGWKDVVLLEQNQLTSGTTWHAAGLIATFGSFSETSIRLRQYTRDLYQKLEAETGQATGFKACGLIELATDEDRLIEYRRIAAFNRLLGVEVHEIGPEEVKRLQPLTRTDDVLAGFYIPADGRVNPVDATMALAKGARQQGVKIVEGVRVTSVNTATVHGVRQVTGVETSGGRIEAEYVVNCAGMWARQAAAQAGVALTNQAAEHYYLITEPIPEVDPDWPVVEDPNAYTYIRPEAGGLMVGLFETEAACWRVAGIPADFAFGEIEPDWERMAPFLEKAMGRVPRTLEVGIKKFFCGPESFTHDLAPLVGEAPELRRYFVAAGLNSVGILTGGGIGRLLAHWLTSGRPDMDVSAMNVDRVHAYQANPAFRAARVTEALGLVYRPHYPTFSMQTARNNKRSPLHERLAAAGAHFKDVSGWEGADWYRRGTARPGLGWGRLPWFPAWAAEHEACRRGVILMDMSFMSKFQVQGRDAGPFLNRLSTANVDGPAGMLTYTQFLNEAGTLEADLTVNKQADSYLVIATDTAHRHVQAWLGRALARPELQGAHVAVTDVTGAWAQLNIQGPRSRDFLQSLTSDDLSNAAFPFRTSREIEIGYARVLCSRITYLGELGYELLVPAEQAVHLYDFITERGAAFGLVHAGLKALASLRMEKAYKDYGHDIENTMNIIEAGLAFTCDFEKEGGFIGKEAVLEMKKAGTPKQRLVQILCKDPEPLMFHGEVVLCNGTPVGDVRAASYGHTLGGAVGLAWVQASEAITPAWLKEQKWEVQIGNDRFPAVTSIAPMYDPKNERIKC